MVKMYFDSHVSVATKLTHLPVHNISRKLIFGVSQLRYEPNLLDDSSDSIPIKLDSGTDYRISAFFNKYRIKSQDFCYVPPHLTQLLGNKLLLPF